MSAPLLAQSLGGDFFFAFIAAIAFATILAVVAGLTISASTSFAHDFYTNVIHRGTERKPGEEVRVARARRLSSARSRWPYYPAGAECECRVSGGAGFCGCGLSQSAGNRSVFVLEEIYHARRGVWPGHRFGRIDPADYHRPEHNGNRCAGCDGRGSLDSSKADLPARESWDTQHSSGIRGRDSWYVDRTRTGGCRKVR